MKEQVKGEIAGPNINVLEAANSKTACVAWFKLADLITRKEKEKALNLYRLLSHSFEDRAYALQVEEKTRLLLINIGKQHSCIKKRKIL
jgi:hypothetical protein